MSQNPINVRILLKTSHHFMISFDFTSKIAEQFDQMAAIVTGDRFFWTNKDGEQRNTQLFTLPLVLDLREGMVR